MLSIRDRALVLTRLFTGLRPAELLDLRVRDVRQNEAIVSDLKLSCRAVPLKVPPPLVAALTALVLKPNPKGRLIAGDRLLFLSRKRGPGGIRLAITQQHLCAVMETVFVRAGLNTSSGLSGQSLRLNFAQSIQSILRKDPQRETSEAYLGKICRRAAATPSQRELDAIILRLDWTRHPRRTAR